MDEEQRKQLQQHLKNWIDKPINKSDMKSSKGVAKDIVEEVEKWMEEKHLVFAL